MIKIIASYSIKGGVGKTALSVNLAYHLAANDRRVLLIDLDPQGASSFYFRVRESRRLKTKGFFTNLGKFKAAIRESDYPNLDILPANLAFRRFDGWLASRGRSTTRLKKVLFALRGEYDYIVLDCPPGISLLSENVFETAHIVVVPVIPTTLSKRTYEQLLGFFDKEGISKKKVWSFFNMVQSVNRLHRDTVMHMRSEYPRFFNTKIPHSVVVEKMGDIREPLFTYANKHPAGIAYEALCTEIHRMLE